jgi:hypothetical protein
MLNDNHFSIQKPSLIDSSFFVFTDYYRGILIAINEAQCSSARALEKHAIGQT